jgi:hypothetical protein
MRGKDRNTRPAQSKADAEVDAGALRALNEILSRLAQLNRQPYDGILGLPPKWMPHPLVHEFCTVRDILLRDHSAQEIRKWMRACRNLGRFPFEYAREIEALIYIQQIAGLGKDDGIDAYLGRGSKKVDRAYAEHARSESQIIEGSKSSARSIAASVTAEKKRQKNAGRNRKIRDAAETLRREGKTEREIPGILARRCVALAGAKPPKQLGELGARQIKRIILLKD